jgi:hypothetical protein
VVTAWRLVQSATPSGLTRQGDEVGGCGSSSISSPSSSLWNREKERRREGICVSRYQSANHLSQFWNSLYPPARGLCFGPKTIFFSNIFLSLFLSYSFPILHLFYAFTSHFLFFFRLSSFFFFIFTLCFFPFSYFSPQITSADIPPWQGGGVFYNI